MLWYLNLWPLYSPSLAATAFFIFGGVLGAKEIALSPFDTYGKYFVILYVGITIVELLSYPWVYNSLLHKTGVLIGFPSIYYFIGIIARHPAIHEILTKLSYASFFVFAAHEPLLQVIKKTAYILLKPSSDVMGIWLYFVIPVLTMIICVFFYCLSRRLFPRFTTIITGGR